jgi:hypothetical protein
MKEYPLKNCPPERIQRVSIDKTPCGMGMRRLRDRRSVAVCTLTDFPES